MLFTARVIDLTWVPRASRVSHDSLLTYTKHDLTVRINYEKCKVALRNQQLVSLAREDIGETTSHVYAVLLNLLEGRIPRCQLDPTIDDLSDINEGPSVSTMELARAMDKSINPSFGIGKVDSHSIKTAALEKPQRKRKREIEDSEATVEGDASSDDEDEDDQDALDDVDKYGNIPEVDQDSDSDGEDPFAEPLTKAPAVKPPRQTKVTFDEKLPKPVSREDRMNRTTDIRNHLLLLADYSPHFVRKCGSRGLGEWTVDFDELVNYMQETELDDIIFEAFGQLGCRIARILRQKGKLEEKQIQKFGLLKLKDVRTKLVEMQMSGIVDIQEVPKDSTRAAGRTIFLWYFDPDRVRMIVLEHIYKTMSRCLQVLKAEKYDQREVLSQAERTDVRGQESEMLPSIQLERLNEIRDTEKKIFTQIGRLDNLVAIFKDF
jgi:DNA-directed RNA polymerase III subunit RPC3